MDRQVIMIVNLMEKLELMNTCEGTLDRISIYVVLHSSVYVCTLNL